MRKILNALLGIAILVLLAAPSADAECLRGRVKNGKVRLKLVADNAGACPKGAVLYPDTPGIFGDGSAGALHITTDTDLDTTNRQFTDITIDPGVGLNVPHGTILRCTGTFTLAGVLRVTRPDDDRVLAYNGTAVNSLLPRFHAPNQGFANGAAGLGEAGNITNARNGGLGGVGLTSLEEARGLLNPGKFGGGSGAANYGASAGAGGGSLTILCRQTINIESTGIIRAFGGNAASGAGSGGGGIAILASGEEILFNGTIQAQGGLAGASDLSNVAAGGGGGGGIVHFIAPSIIDLGTVDVSGGTAFGAVAGGTLTSIMHGGGGGGGSGGNGGAGGTANADGSATAGEAGDDGYFIKSIADPRGLFS